MKNFIKLVRFEFNRVAPVYGVLAILTLLIQIVGVFVTTNGYLNSVNELKQMGTIDDSMITSDIGTMGMMRYTSTLWFLGPITFCAAALLIYSLFIWYRDWFGKNTFVYRLLMLPTQRLNILFSKVTTVFLMVIGLVAFQLILLHIESNLFQMLIPKAYFSYANINQIIRGSYYLSIFYPASGILFFSRYIQGLLGLLVVSTAILLERSYKIKGMVMGGCYAALILLLFAVPYLLQVFNSSYYLFSSEIFWISIGLTVIISIVSILISHHLLNKKVTV